MTQALGVDIGGTKMSASLVDESGVLSQEFRMATPPADQLPQAVAELVDLADPGGRRTATGIAIAALVDHDGRMIAATNLPGIDPDFRRAVEREIGGKVVVENDATAAAWGEYRFGAAVGFSDVLMVTCGTGVGGGIVIGGQLVRGAHGAAAELGHICVVPDGPACGCGQRGCLEQFASGSALSRGLSIAEAGDWLGRGLASLVAVLDPQIVVIGGGVSDVGEELLGPARASLAEHLPNPNERAAPPVVRAALGNAAGIVGAADLARS